MGAERQSNKSTNASDDEGIHASDLGKSSGFAPAPSSRGCEPPSSASDPREGLRAFRAHCDKAVTAAMGGDAAVPLVEAACRLVDAIVFGILDHLPEVRAEVLVRTSQQFAEARAAGEDRELVNVLVTFAASSPMVGEIVTRSRVPLSMHVARELRFGLLRPIAKLRDRPLELRVDGLEMLVLSDAVRARTQLRAELGEGLNPMSAYAWWEQHRHTEFPIEHSKFHRVVESLLEQRGMKMLGTKVCADSFWGYLHTTDLSVEVFEFHWDARMRGGIAMTVRMRAPRSSTESEDRAKVKAITHKMLRQNRPSADRLCPSAISIGAMISGPEVGQPGACPKIVAKLFSAARWWGRGEESWHRHDESWLCTDKKDRFGRMLEEQGRVIWRLATSDKGPPIDSKTSSNKQLDSLLRSSSAQVDSLIADPGKQPDPPGNDSLPPCQSECSTKRRGMLSKLARLTRKTWSKLNKQAVAPGKAAAGGVEDAHPEQQPPARRRSMQFTVKRGRRGRPWAATPCWPSRRPRARGPGLPTEGG